MRYELVRSNRKTLALTVNREGRLVARAPLHTPLTQIEAFIREKQSWIDRTMARLAMLPPPPKALALTDGAVLPYLGRSVVLRLAPVSRITLSGDALLVPASATDISPVVRWLEAQARALLAERVQCLSRQLSLYPKTQRLTHAKGRWGSMSTRGTLSLNRALIHCPPDVVDYVILHELCHIRHPNHSAQFWAMVERCMPDYRTKRDWLRANQSLIRVLPS